MKNIVPIATQKILLRYLLLTSLLLCPILSSAKTVYQLKGLSDELTVNVDAHIKGLPEDDFNTSKQFQARLAEAVRSALQADGYYEPIINITIDSSGRHAVGTINVSAGKPVRYQEIDIVFDSFALDDPNFKKVLKGAPKKGDILNHKKYDNIKKQLQRIASKKGYFDAKFIKKRLEVAPSRHMAFLKLEFHSGHRYNFGPVTFTGSQIEQDRLSSLTPFNEGDPYLSTKLGEFNQSLSGSSWFSSIVVSGDTDNMAGYELPIDVQLAPSKRNKVEVGIGYSTDVQTRLKLNWDKPWINAQGHSLHSAFSLSKPEQLAEFSYKIPLEDVLKDYYQFQLGFKGVDNLDTDSQEYTFGFERDWIFDNDWHRTAFLRISYEDYIQADEEDETLLLMPGLTYTRTQLQKKPMPDWGNKQQMTLELSDPTWGSDTRFARVQLGTAWIQGNNNNRGLFRLDAGAVFIDDITNAPPSIRFFVGGDNSIRGYRYESIAPKDSDDQLIGGQYQTTSSLEYQRRIMGKWWGALFFDIGSAWTDAPIWYKGTGVGVRWASPVGPVRIDLAWGLDAPKDDAQYQIHFSLGPEL
ncbi:autotransporter assembly complex protein TamA [Vibrio sp. SS-MA-C1-2]|uniref:autotransporter assembly complex protein TamA n=1 Tax=Vibrio sp. SS-MA-C1-2 TaxID=2908646 RepID=UPI001F1D8282|nr:autotransporter assembly complex family protein [Vibrio sp. SS-MA-C1-2]UJF19511.1 autotransporter assembly complex protein TamA [Vibrio sp. SS-MA-C1-2]